MALEPEGRNMSILDDMQKSLNDFGDNMIQFGRTAAVQTKQFADTTRLGAKAADKKRVLNQQYAELGEAVFAKLRAVPDNEYQDLIDKIKKTQLEIKDLEDQAAAVKGVKRCPECGAQNPLDADYCCKCGRSLQDEV